MINNFKINFLSGKKAKYCSLCIEDRNIPTPPMLFQFLFLLDFYLSKTLCLGHKPKYIFNSKPPFFVLLFYNFIVVKKTSSEASKMTLEWIFLKLFGMASFDSRRRQEQGKCTKQKQKQKQNPKTDLFGRTRLHTIISSYVLFLLLCFIVFPTISATQFDNLRRLNQTFRPGEESKKMRLIRSHLLKINKPSVKSIQVYFD